MPDQSSSQSPSPMPQLPPMSQGFWALMKRDLVLAFRQRGDMINPLFFFLMVVSLFPLGVGPEPGQLQKMAPGIIWIAALLSTLLAVDSLFRQDFDDGALELLLLSPHPLFSLVGAKVLAHWLVTAIPLILASPFLGLMLFLEGEQLLVVMLTLILGTPVLSMISAIGAALTVGLRKGGVLIAIIALPLYVPVLIFGTSAIEAASIGMPFIGQVAYLGALLALAITFAPFAIAAGLRVSVSG